MRETIMLETKHEKHKVKIKTFLTERENRGLVQILSANYSFSGEGEAKAENIKSDVLLEYQNKLIEVWITEIDGKTDNMLEAMLDFRKEDFKEVIDKINGLSQEDEKKTKK